MSVHDAADPADGRQLVSLLHGQHEELHEKLARLPMLHGSAREDLFLQARRLLAVHETLERVLESACGTEPAARSSLADDVAAAEALDHESPEFDEAFARVVAGHLRHARSLEGDLLTVVERLPSEDRDRVTRAVRMWRGDGDTYLGNTYDEMLTAAHEELRCPPVPDRR